MNLRQLLVALLISISMITIAQEPVKIKFYGYVGNELFYNSRQNIEMVDGVIQLFPKPISLKNGVDENAVHQAEMLSVNSRLGFDITGAPILNAKTSGKMEADFAGFGTNFYVLRIRQAYMKLNWTKTELLVGQTWHPLFGNVAPSTISSNGGAPFQPFNRSPQIRVKQNLCNTLSVTAAALYEMQYTSQGPIGSSNTYLKNALTPDVYVGVENKTSHWINGIGVDCKRLKPDANYISSISAAAFTQYTGSKFTAKAKLTYGENLTDQLMLGGYGVSKFAADLVTPTSYTNFRNASLWINPTYGTKFQVGLMAGISRNLGTTSNLVTNKDGKFISYGYGVFDQKILNTLWRVAPQVVYNIPSMKFGIEYDLTSASYGSLNAQGRVSNPTTVINNRVLASVSYIF